VLSTIPRKVLVTTRMVRQFWRQGLEYARKNGVRAAWDLTIRALRGKELLGPAGVSAKPFEVEQLARDIQVLLVSANPRSASHDYRVSNIARAFELLGRRVAIISQERFETLTSAPADLVLIWFWRTQCDLESLRISDQLAAKNVHLHYDTDDLTFDPKAYNAKDVPALGSLPKNVQHRLFDIDLHAQRRQIARCHTSSATTEFLASKLAELAPRAFVIPNVLTEEMSTLARTLPINAFGPDFKIVFASGTPTHRADFLGIWPSLLSFLDRHPDVQLDLLGSHPITKDEVPFQLVTRVNFLPLVSQNVLLSAMANYDLSLAPLENETDFNRAKSAIKVIHAAATGTRTLASYTVETFTTMEVLNAGLCLKNFDDWTNALEQEYADSQVNRKHKLDLRLSDLDNFSLINITTTLNLHFGDLFA
jgi:hypothetical protein